MKKKVAAAVQESPSAIALVAPHNVCAVEWKTI